MIPQPRQPRPGRTLIWITLIVCLTTLLIATEKYGSNLLIEDVRCFVLIRAMHTDNIEEFRRAEPNLRDYFQIPPDLPTPKPKHP